MGLFARITAQPSASKSVMSGSVRRSVSSPLIFTVLTALLLIFSTPLKGQTIVKYGVIVIVGPTDTKQGVRETLDNLDTIMTGVGLNGSPPETWFDYYVWTGSVPERQAWVTIGFDVNAPINTINEINKNSAAHAQIAYYGNESRAWMEWHASRIAYYNNGAIYQLILTPGLSLNFTTMEEWLSRFTLFNPSVPEPPK